MWCIRLCTGTYVQEIHWEIGEVIICHFDSKSTAARGPNYADVWKLASVIAPKWGAEVVEWSEPGRDA